ncbi:MAG: hypothetical protein Q9220_003899 [cf. Caloplaca sp. 1 TL-2023]
MSGLEVSAGIIAIAGAGIAVAKGLFGIADAIGTAGWEVRFCAADTDLFSQMLLNLSTLFERSASPSLPHSTHRIAEDLLELCERILAPFQHLISKLEPLLRNFHESQHQLRQIGVRVQWYFRHKSKISLHQQVLGQLKATLSLFLNSVNLQESRANNAPNAADNIHPETPMQSQPNESVYNDPEMELDEDEGNALYVDSHALRNRVSRFAEDSLAGNNQIRANSGLTSSSTSLSGYAQSESIRIRENLRRRPVAHDNAPRQPEQTFILNIIKGKPEEGVYGWSKKYIVLLSSCRTWKDLERKIDSLNPRKFDYSVSIYGGTYGPQADETARRSIGSPGQEYIVTPDVWEVVVTAECQVVVRSP